MAEMSRGVDITMDIHQGGEQNIVGTEINLGTSWLELAQPVIWNLQSKLKKTSNDVISIRQLEIEIIITSFGYDTIKISIM